MRRIGVALLAVALASAAAAAGGFFWLRGRGRPQRSGRTAIPSLATPVQVRWDRWGVPHARAASGRDLAAALGFLHANDRMDQLELGRRAAAGRLAEIAGEAAVPLDVENLTLRLRKGAEGLWRSAGPESREWLLAYAGGVNAWLASRDGDLPPGLTLLGVEPEPWTPVDSLSFAMLMAQDLSFWQGRPEETRLGWLARVGADRARELLGRPDAHLSPEIARTAEALPRHLARDEAERSARVRHAARHLPSFRGAAAGPPAGSGGDWRDFLAAPGSNNWALGLSRSAEHGPIVANDPHLSFHLPGTWYQVHLRSPDYEAAGMTLPGLPGVVIGQSARLAWALTNYQLDDHDLFFEDFDAERRSVRRGDAWVPVVVEEHEIRVRGGGPRGIELLATDRGPLLPAAPELGLPARSLAWTAHLPADPLGAFLKLARARNAEAVPGRVDGFVCPAQNLVVADRDGALLHVVLGRTPRRRLGDGAFPSPGWDLAYGWDGLLPAEANPRRPRPSEDLLVTANQDIRRPGEDPAFPGDFDLPARAERIAQLLATKSAWGAVALAAVQTDLVSLYAVEVVERLGDGFSGDAEKARAALAAWDGRMAPRGPAALFALLERRLVEGTFGDEVDLTDVSWLVRRRWLLDLLCGAMDPDWFDDRGTPALETRRDVVSHSLTQAWSEAVRRWGPAPASWDYGELHPLTLDHPLGRVPIVGRFFNRGPFTPGGSATTIAAFGGPWRGETHPVTYGPSMRWIAVVGDPDNSLAILPDGQSGHPFDRHYSDQTALYLRGELRPVAWSESAIEAATVSRLELLPGAGSH